ncbi:MAG: 3'(2'),5'-bisphosphate nucleotidase CysQ [Pseudomonadota bacterium]
MPDAALAADLKTVIAAAKAGGALAAKHFKTTIKIWDKAKGDPVTEIDLAVNDLLETALRSARPSYGWLSEETKDTPQRLSAKRAWVVDPIDGTRAYIKGLPEYCISIACVEDGQPLLGVLYDPSADKTYAALAGGGAQLNGTPITVSDWSDTLTSRMIMAQDMAEHRLWPKPWHPRALVRPNSMALRLGWVASGAYDLTIALSDKQDWDIAAADIILSEAGGHLTDHHGKVRRYNQANTSHPFVVGAAPGVHTEACAQIRGLVANYQAEQAAQQ